MSGQLWKPVENLEGFEQDIRSWLAQHMSAEMPWLLVHADDGVIWGRWEPDGNVRLSSDVFKDTKKYPAIAVALQPTTVQQCRVFGRSGEVLIWREGMQFRGRIMEDDDTASEDRWDEVHLLWGSPVEVRDGFSLLREGRQGPQHAVPIVVPQARRAALTVRHYVQPDRYGQAVVVLSRLVHLGLHEAGRES